MQFSEWAIIDNRTVEMISEETFSQLVDSWRYATNCGEGDGSPESFQDHLCHLGYDAVHFPSV